MKLSRLGERAIVGKGYPEGNIPQSKTKGAKEAQVTGFTKDKVLAPHHPLANLAMEENPNNILLMWELLAQGFPPSADILSLLNQVVGSSKVSPHKALILVYLWSHNLPITKSFIKPLSSLLEDDGSVFPDLFRLVKELSGPGEGDGVESLLHLLQFPSPRNAPQMLKNLAQRLGLEYEANIGAYLARDGSSSPDSDLNLCPDGPLRGNKNLKSMLLSLSQNGKLKFAPALQGLLDKITGLQILHTTSNGLHVLGWFGQLEENPPFFLSLWDDEGCTDPGMDKYRKVIIYTKLPHLGPILLELHLHNASLTCMMTMEDVHSRNVLDEYRQGLAKALVGLAQQIRILPCRLGETGSLRRVWLGKIMANPFGQQHIDIHV